MIKELKQIFIKFKKEISFVKDFSFIQITMAYIFLGVFIIFIFANISKITADPNNYSNNDKIIKTKNIK